MTLPDKRQRPQTYYLHTLNGMPAVFVPKQGICFASFYGSPNKLAHSLQQIRREQAEAKRLDGQRHEAPGTWRYGYLRVTP